MDFASHLISQVNGINRIILFGSVARDDFNEESDIDLFIDTIDKKLEKKVQLLVDNFYKTKKAKNWELKGINNPFSCEMGELDSDEWKDLKRGMLNNGIILYGKYKASSEKIYQYTLFSFPDIKPESKRVGLHRKLFGFKLGKKRYAGLIEKYSLIPLGKGNIAVSIEHSLKIKKIFKEKKIPVKVYDLWSDYELK
ncbi:MAG: nucleotidyltransferase domain-containing protein [Candidatus Woesearchaeota archaeon]